MGGNTRSIEHLTTPDLNLRFHQDPSTGIVSVTIPTNRSGNESQLPLMQALMKNKEELESSINNILIADGRSTQLSQVKVNVSGEVNGKVGGGLEGGGGGKVKGVVDLSGKLQGNTEVGGKAAGGVEFQITPGQSGPSKERQQQLQDLLDQNVNAFCLQWAKDHPKGASVPLPNGDTLKVSEKVINQYIEANDPQKKAEKLFDDLMDGVNSIKKKFNLSSDAGTDATQGFASPDHPYHRMYADALGRIGEMTPRPGGDQRPETLAAALVQSAAEARFDPDKPITVAGGRDGGALFAIQGTPGDPASRQAHIDTTEARAPTAEQVAQAQPPARDDGMEQTRQQSAMSRA